MSEAADPQAPVRVGIPDHGRVPKYFAVKAQLEGLLDRLGEGGLLPTERELAAGFGVAVVDVHGPQRALGEGEDIADQFQQSGLIVQDSSFRTRRDRRRSPCASITTQW